MKLRVLSCAILSVIAVSSYAAANTPDLSALQAQINSLENQINSLNTQNSLSQAVMLDTAAPINAMSDTIIPLQVLQAKPTLSAPLVIGGSLEGDAQWWNGSFSTTDSSGNVYQTGTGIYLTSANLAFMANLGTWVTGVMTLQGNVGGSQNSGFQVDKAFLVVGNLQKNPLFLTVGEAYVPFGVFSGNGPYANSLDTNMFRISKTNQLALNFFQNGLSTSFALFNSKASPSSLNDFAYNINYATTGNFNYSIGAGYLRDIRGTNSGLGAAFPDEATSEPALTTTYNVNSGRNAVYDINGAVNYGLYGLVGQYDTTQDSATNRAGQSVGGKMAAWNITGSYKPTILNLPTTLSLGYSATRNMATIPMPLVGLVTDGAQTAGNVDNNSGMQHQWQLAASSQVMKNVYTGPEFDYQHLYSGKNTWTLVYDMTAYF